MVSITGEVLVTVNARWESTCGWQKCYLNEMQENLDEYRCKQAQCQKMENLMSHSSVAKSFYKLLANWALKKIPVAGAFWLWKDLIFHFKY